MLILLHAHRKDKNVVIHDVFVILKKNYTCHLLSKSYIFLPHEPREHIWADHGIYFPVKPKPRLSPNYSDVSSSNRRSDRLIPESDRMMD